MKDDLKKPDGRVYWVSDEKLPTKKDLLDALFGAIMLIIIFSVCMFFVGYYTAEVQSGQVSQAYQASKDNGCKACMTEGEYNDYKWIGE